ncbi:MAG: PfkB family carbohydrate kinase [Actinomycetota bacterium]|nr:PfkB family carbohydrate kinase [Actinomycetota bacterium]
MTPAPRGSALVAVVGDVMNDVVVRPLRAIEHATDTPSEIEFSHGGSGANQAAFLAALGIHVRFVGRAGVRDASGHRQSLERLGVEVRLGEDPDLPTGTVVVLVSADGERSMFTDRGANRRLGAGDLEGVLDGAALLHISAYQLLEPQTRRAIRTLLAAARRAGIPTSVDPSSHAGLRAAGRAAFFKWTAGARLVFPNLDEGRLLSGEVEPEAIVSSLLRSYEIVALKLGGDGALAGTAEGERVRLAARTATVVDSTGAGDAFCAGFLARFVDGGSLAECTAGALQAAAGTVERVGARPPGGQGAQLVASSSAARHDRRGPAR